MDSLTEKFSLPYESHELAEDSHEKTKFVTDCFKHFSFFQHSEDLGAETLRLHTAMRAPNLDVIRGDVGHSQGHW